MSTRDAKIKMSFIVKYEFEMKRSEFLKLGPMNLTGLNGVGLATVKDGIIQHPKLTNEKVIIADIKMEHGQ